MSLATYDDLQDAVAGWLERADLTDRIPDFITLAEAQITADLVANGGLRQMVLRARAVLDTAFSEVPPDFAGARSFKLDGFPALELISFDEMADRKSFDPTVGIPTAYAVVGGEFEFHPVPQEAFEGILTYLRRVPALSDSVTTNWLLTASPDVYLYGALMASAPYLVDDQRLPVWGSLYSDALNRLLRAEAFETYGGAPTSRRRSFG